MRNKALLIIVAVLLGGVMLTLLLLFQNNSHDWRMSYKPKDTEPYGTHILSDILERTGDYEIVSDTIYNQLGADATGNYVFVGRKLYMDSLELDFLLKFVERGGHAYIFSTDQHYRLLDTLLFIPDYSYSEENTLYNQNFLQAIRDTMITASIETDTTKLYDWKHHQPNKVVTHSWSHFSYDISSADENNEVEYLGYFQHPNDIGWYMNYIGRDYGAGRFVFHTNPEVLTNYYLLDSLNFEYASRVFSDMNDGPVYFDENNQNFQFSNYSSGSAGGATKEGPLSYILSQPPLRWAWYLLLLSCVIYLIFGAKRKQRIIPVLEPNNNTSIEFAETVSQLYLRQKDHRKISLTKMKLFLAFIRERYGLKTIAKDKKEEKQLAKRIANLSEVDEEHVQRIFDEHQKIIVAYEVTNKMLVDFHHLIDHFYKNCK